MMDYTKIEALRHRLIEERRKVTETAAASDTLPPAKLLAYLANLDSAVMAVESVLEERTSLQVSTNVSDDATLDEAFA